MNKTRSDDFSLVSQSTDSVIQEETDRFVKHGPLLNLLILSVGPILKTLGMSVLDSVDLMIISQRFKNDPDSYAVQIIGVTFFILQICTNIGLFLSQAVMVRVSSLLGSGERYEAAQLTVDIFRISVIVTIITTYILTFVARPIMTFAGCTADLLEPSYLLLISTISALPIYTFFHVGTAFLQAIGRPVLNGILHLAANVLQTFIMTPFLQFALKVNVTLSSLSQPFSQSIIAIILFVLIFMGKFSLKPSLKMFFAPFSSQTRKAISMAFPMLPMFCYTLIPPTLLLRYITSACETDSGKTDVIAVFTVIQKMIMMCILAPVALASGYITAATHALSMGNHKRMLMTYFWVVVIDAVFAVAIFPILIFKPLILVKFFTTVQSQLDFAEIMAPIPVYTMFLNLLIIGFSPLFVSIGRPVMALIVPVSQLVVIIVGGKVISVLYPNDPTKIPFAYTISDIVTFSISIPMVIYSLIPIYRKSKEVQADSTPLQQSISLSSTTN